MPLPNPNPPVHNSPIPGDKWTEDELELLKAVFAKYKVLPSVLEFPMASPRARVKPGASAVFSAFRSAAASYNIHLASLGQYTKAGDIPDMPWPDVKLFVGTEDVERVFEYIRGTRGNFYWTKDKAGGTSKEDLMKPITDAENDKAAAKAEKDKAAAEAEKDKAAAEAPTQGT